MQHLCLSFNHIKLHKQGFCFLWNLWVIPPLLFQCLYAKWWKSQVWQPCKTLVFCVDKWCRVNRNLSFLSHCIIFVPTTILTFQLCLSKTDRNNMTSMCNNVSKYPGPFVTAFSIKTVFLKMLFVIFDIDTNHREILILRK